MHSTLGGEKRQFEGPQDGNKVESEEEKEACMAGSLGQTEKWNRIKLDRWTEPRSFRHGRS